MKTSRIFTLGLTAMLMTFALSIESVAQTAPTTAKVEIGEINPFDKDIEQQLNSYDEQYIEENGQAPYALEDLGYNLMAGCYRNSCNVWIQVVKSTQLAYLYVNGALVDTFKVSSGIPGRETPNFDKNPNGRIYTKYSSTKYPGGDYNGLGNMPYAVFIHGGFALHGTPRGNWPKLGKKASHGCIRMHPDKAVVFNSLVKEYGIRNVWITVQN